MKARRIAGPLLLLLTIASFGMWVHGAVPDVPTGQWLPGPALAQPREGAVSVALDDGRVLVIGGRTASGPVSTVEVFDANGSLAVGAHLLSRRAGHTATKLPDGSVLVVGGRTLVTTDDGSGPVTAETVTNSAEVFDVNAGVWYPAASLSIARSGHTATAVADGHVVVAGGVGTDGAALDSFEVFDPEWGVFSSPGLLSAARTEHAAAAAGATKVLVAGGRNANGVLSTGDVVNAANGSVTGVMLNSPRAGASATALLDGTILLAGGSDGVNDLASAEIVDPVSGFSALSGSMTQGRRGHQAVLLNHNATVLVLGGTRAGIVVSGAEQFVPWTGQFSATGSPATPRSSAVLSNLAKDGVAWLAAGRSNDGGRIGGSELYGFATVKTDRNDYAPGMTVTMSGSGWQPGERVTLLLHEVSTGHADRTYLADADPSGHIINSEFLVDTQHIGVRFFLTARGAGSQAQTTFTDGNLQSDVTFSLGPGTVSSGATLSWTATATCQGSGNGNNTCAANGFVVDGPVADGYLIVVERSPNSNFNPANSITSVVTTSTTGGAVGGTFTAPAAEVPITTARTMQTKRSPNSWQPADSNTVQITVTSCTPAVTTHPTSQSITYGQNASFVAAANGTPAPTVQWQVSTDNGANWNNLVGATSTTLSLNQPTVAMSGNRYRAVFTNTCNGTQTATTSAATLTVAKAASTTTVTFEAGPYIYRGSAFTATASASGAGGLSQNVSVVYSGDCTNVTTANGCTASASYAGDSNHNASADTKSIMITPASATVNVTGYSGTYDGGAHGASGSATGVGGVDLSALLNLGAAFTNVPGGTALWTFNAGSASKNYNPASGTANIIIEQATSTAAVTFEDGPYVYRGSAFTATASATGAGGLSEDIAVVYSGDCTNVTTADGCTATANYTGDTNHKPSSDSKSMTITPATAMVNVTGFLGTYDGDAHGASGTATGVGDVDLSALLHLGSSFIDVPGGTASWTFNAGSVNKNYNPVSGTADIVIEQATSTAAVTFEDGPYVYRGSAFTATASATGAGGLSEDIAVVYSGVCTNVTTADGCTATANYTGDTNHKPSSDSKSITITPATAMVNVTGFSGTYDGDAHGASGTATGVGGVDLSALLNLGASFTNVPGGTANWTFNAGSTNPNYASTSGTAPIVINKAASTTVVTFEAGPYVYRGSAFTATANVTGAGALDQSVPVVPSGDCVNVTSANGCTATATFAGDGNHDGSTDAKSITITPATATVNVTGFTGTYDGAAHGASGSATGVGGVDLSALLNLGASFTNVPGGTANWTFNAGSTNPNYASTSGTAPIVINKAASTTTTVGAGPFTYDTTTHTGGSGTVTGAGLTTSATSLSYTGDQVNAGTYYVTAHYAGDANHEPSDGAAVAIVINKAASTTTIACPSSVTYTGLAQTPCTASVAGIGGLNQAVPVTHLDNIYPGTATANASYSGDANHEVSSDSKTFAITYGLCSPGVGAGGVVLQPINSDGTSVFPRKGGSTLPVKFRVCDASGNPIANPAAVFAGTGGSLTMLSAVRGTVDVVNEPGVMEIPDAGFRFSGNQWVFNMATSNLAQGTTYTFRINLASGSIAFRVAVK